MAKKKAAPASPFVPVEEQPYPIPENWCWTRIGSLSSLHRGVSYRKDDAHATKESDDCLIMRGGNIGEGYITTDVDNVYVNKSLVDRHQFVRQNDIIIVASTGSTKVIGRAGISTTDYEDVSFGTFLMLVRPVNKSNPKYLDFFFQCDDYRNQIRNLASGVNINNIRADYITDMPIPVPPLPEQHRIVDRIESLFTKLDEAKEKAQAVVDGFELRKSAILHKAFTGKLTERWRKEHGVGLDSWTDTTIGEQAELITKGASPRWQGVEYTDDKSQTLFVTSENVREGYLDFTKEKYLSNEINDIQKRSVLNYGDVLVNIVGASIGRAAIYNLHQLANTNQAVCIVRLKPGISNEFVCAYLNAPLAQSYYYDNKVETARANVSLGSISAMHINLPTSFEQKEIVDTLNMILEKEQQAQEAAEAVLGQIDTMKKAILARAFRGELGTNDSEEEWAGELVREILKVEVPPQPRARAVFIPEELEKRLESELERKIIKLYLKSDAATLSINVLMAVSSKKFEVMDALRNLEQRGIIKKLNNGNYSLVR